MSKGDYPYRGNYHMHKLLLEIPTQIETERIYLRCYQPGDGSWFYPMSQKNQAHLSRYEADNPVMSICSEDAAEIVVRQFAASWVARSAFFLGAFEKTGNTFVAQVYIGLVSWDLPEFEIGYFAEQEHQGLGFVTEAVKAALKFIFESLEAHRVCLQWDETNVRSWRVAERCGFVREGHLRQNKKNPDSSITGTYCYGLLKEEVNSQYG